LLKRIIFFNNGIYIMRTFNLAATAIATGLAMATTASGQDTEGNAVRNINGKLSLGYFSGDGASAGTGAALFGGVAVPVSSAFGVQLDFSTDNIKLGSGAVTGSDGIGLHLFTRDPSKYLVGLYVDSTRSSATTGKVKGQRIGIEGELYFEDVTVAGFIGRDRVTQPSGIVNKFDAFELSIGYFVNDNTRLTARYEDSFGMNTTTVGVEHLFDVKDQPLSIFAEYSSVGGGETISVGGTVYFGNKGMSLKQIERENDPRVRVGPSAPRMSYFEALSSGGMKKVYCKKCK
jgi:hypothetical protein